MRILNRIPLRSIRFRLLALTVAVFIPILAFSIVNNLYAMRIVERQTIDSMQSTVAMYVGQLDTSLARVKRFLSSLDSSYADIKLLESGRRDNEPLLAGARMKRRLSDALFIYGAVDGLFLYSPASRVYMDALDSTDDQAQIDRMRAFLEDGGLEALHAEHQGSWFPVHVGETDYLLHLNRIGDTWVGSWARMERLLQPFHGSAFSLVDQVKFSTGDREVAASGFLVWNGARHLAIRQDLTQGDLSVLLFVPAQNVFHNLPLFRHLIWLLAGLFSLLLAALLILLRRMVLRPMNRLIVSLREMRNGNLDVRITGRAGCEEFVILDEAFNDMTREIRKLKIDVYEEKLMKQKAELQFYQLQIRPHFFLNALNILYNLAQVGNFQLVQEMTLALGEYFRYALKSAGPKVRLRDELHHVENYLRIQQIRLPKHFHHEVEADPETLDVQVPPLVLQTFVENSVKYAANIDEPVMLYIRIERLDDAAERSAVGSADGSVEQSADGAADCAAKAGGRIAIRIHDTGPGFPLAALDRFSQLETLPGEDGHGIGIRNILQRLRLIYGDAAEIGFSNAQPHGACVDVVVPAG